MNVQDTPLLFPFLRREKAKADMLVTHRFGFAKVQEAFEVFASRKSVKVILRPWD